MEIEKQMVSAFKNECGESFSTSTEVMFSSTSESETFTELFKASTNKLPFTNFDFKVIEQKTWPIDT